MTAITEMLVGKMEVNLSFKLVAGLLGILYGISKIRDQLVLCQGLSPVAPPVCLLGSCFKMSYWCFKIVNISALPSQNPKLCIYFLKNKHF